MTTETQPPAKKPFGTILSLLVVAAIAAYFIVPQVMRERGVPSSETLAGVERVKQKIGAGTFDNVMKALLPAGYAAMCSKQHGENAALIAAAKAHADRNKDKIAAAVAAMKAAGLTADDKAAIDKYGYSRVAGDINTGIVACDGLVDRINRGEWDL
jgi:hypothetical protein